MEVSAPPGNVIGFIEQVSSGKYPTFDVTNTSGETLLKIRGPFCLLACLPWCYCCYGEIAYKVFLFIYMHIKKILEQKITSEVFF